MKIHELKTDKRVFSDSVYGFKTFEIRRNDRDFQMGDILILRETEHSGAEMAKGMPLRYTGMQITRKVEYILSGYGLDKEWVVMAVVPV